MTPRLVTRLCDWGYLPPGEANPSQGELDRAIAAYGDRWGAGSKDEALSLIERRFCSCADIEHANGGLARWPHKEVTFSTALQLRQADVQQSRDYLIEKVLAHINESCGLSMKLVGGSGGNIHQTGATSRSDRQLDGAGGTLAYNFLPWAGISATKQLSQVLDLDERWSSRMFWLVVLHETLHGLGVSHNQGPEVCIMDPHLNLDLNALQPWDLGELVSRYGKPVTTPKPAPGGGDPYGQVVATVQIGERVYTGQLFARA